MRLHRFYVHGQHNKYGPIELSHDFWLQDQGMINQWKRVLRFQPGQQLVLFDGLEHDRLYELVEITDLEAHLQLITDMERKLPTRDVYLLWSLLKNDKNDWVIQKATELGVSHLLPLQSERTEKTGFDLERAQKIAIEAAEQCGRSDIPSVREPMQLTTAIDELQSSVKLFICQQGGEISIADSDQPLGVLIGPEGGWSDSELELFNSKQIAQLDLHDFTLRAETAAIAAVTQLMHHG
jgi:16S rRNA (uracil1498-N3)-methyltransferase